MIRVSMFVYSVAGIVGGTIVPAQLPAQPGPPGAPAVTNKFYSSSGKWVQVSNKNCMIWSSWPRGGESVNWSGGVADGKAYGEGILQWFTNGIPTSSYEGEVKDGLADGHGIAKGSGEEYEGEWKRGGLVSTNGTYQIRRWELVSRGYQGRVQDRARGGIDEGRSQVRWSIQERSV